MRKCSLILWCVLLIGAVMAAAPIVASAKPRVQTVKIRISERGYEPSRMKLRRGIPARVTFLRTTDATCAKEIVLPDFGIRRALPLNQPVLVSFTPTKKGAFTFVCGMNMLRGTVIVAAR